MRYITSNGNLQDVKGKMPSLPELQFPHPSHGNNNTYLEPTSGAQYTAALHPHSLRLPLPETII